MVKSMYAAVAGLKTHQSKLDVIGNNIANVNTYGYKKERSTFADTYYSTTRTASEATNVKGGVNPSQVGYGVKMAGVDTIVTTGGAAITDNPTDAMISGNGYFLVGSYNAAGYTTTSAESGADDTRGLTSLYLTRVGAFSFDGQGNFVDTGSQYVHGFASARGVQYLFSASATDDNGYTTYSYIIPANEEAGTEEKTATVSEIRATDGTLTGYTVSYPGDKEGETLSFKLSKGDFNPSTADSLYVLPGSGEYSDAKTYTIDESTGYIKNIATGVVVTLDDKLTAIQIPRTYTLNGYTTKDGKPLTVTLFNENDSMMVNAYPEATDDNQDVEPQVLTITGEEYWAVARPMELSSISIGSDGTVTGVNSEKTVMSLGKIAVANVPNPGALENQGDSYYLAKANTGVVEAFNPGDGSTGTLAAGTLEMSNCDLSTEFTEMITTQRGYQANARIITVTDSMLEELVNLKRG